MEAQPQLLLQLQLPLQPHPLRERPSFEPLQPQQRRQQLQPQLQLLLQPHPQPQFEGVANRLLSAFATAVQALQHEQERQRQELH